MKHLNYILIFLIVAGCTSTKKTIKSSSKSTKFIFQKSIVSNSKSEPNSLANKKNLDLSLLTQTPEIKIHLEVINDSIWRHKEQNSKMIGDYVLIQKHNGFLNYYDKSKSVNYRKYDLFSENDEYKVIINKKNRKTIKGFDCFKLSLIKMNTDSDLGNTTYEMYVTKKIDLPIHSVISLTKLFTNTFPMEIKITEGGLPNISELYKLVEIKY